MVFIGGARQVGKTSMAKYIAEHHYKRSDYLNWDVREDRRHILQSSFKGDAQLILFDEIHKYEAVAALMKFGGFPEPFFYSRRNGT